MYVYFLFPAVVFLFFRIKKAVLFLFNISKELVHRFFRHKIGYTGGELAYFFILSIFPFLIFTNSAIRALDIPRDAAVSFLRPFLPEEIVPLIAEYLEYINTRKTGGILSFGIILAIFSASKSVRALSFSFDLAYGSRDNRGFFLRVVSSMLCIFLFAIVFVVCVVLVAFGNGFVSKILLGAALPPSFLWLLSFWRWVTISAILFLVLLAVYKFLPRKRLTFRTALPGTVFSLFSFLILGVAFSFYTRNFVSSASLYGSFSAVVLLMLWFYFAGIILVLGAELNAVISDSH